MIIFKSATKIVFLLMTIAFIAGFFMGKITGDQFLVLVNLVFGYYFWDKKAAQPSIQTPALG